MWWFRFQSVLCALRFDGHEQWTMDGFHVCLRCWQSLDAETGQALGWKDYNYHPEKFYPDEV